MSCKHSESVILPDDVSTCSDNKSTHGDAVSTCGDDIDTCGDDNPVLTVNISNQTKDQMCTHTGDICRVSESFLYRATLQLFTR